MTADHRSVHPDFPGVPWWGAVLLTVTATAVGFAFDAGSGNNELSAVFAALYVLGCLVAVLAVRQSGLFTAVIQPPLILFISVPGAYFLFNGGTFTGVRDTLINSGYPLIERFPLMFFTSAIVLLIGLARWYYASTHAVTPRTAPSARRTSRVTSKGEPDDDAEADASPRRRRSVERPARAAKPAADTARAARPARTPAGGSSAPSRARHTGPSESAIIEPVVDRPRRARSPRQPEPSDEPRRRARQSNRDPRRTPPPAERRSPYERSQRRSRYDYEPLEPHPSNGSAGSNGTHHPVSRVRYRGEDDGLSSAEYPTRTRSRHAREPDGWEPDI